MEIWGELPQINLDAPLMPMNKFFVGASILASLVVLQAVRAQTDQPRKRTVFNFRPLASQ